jgi:hypothetical protein
VNGIIIHVQTSPFYQACVAHACAKLNNLAPLEEKDAQTGHEMSQAAGLHGSAEKGGSEPVRKTRLPSLAQQMPPLPPGSFANATSFKKPSKMGPPSLV